MRKWLIAFIITLTACGAQPTTSVAPTSAPSLASTTVVAVPSATAVARSAAAPTVSAATQPTATVPAATTSDALSESTNANGERVLGNPSAPITLADYSDFL